MMDKATAFHEVYHKMPKSVKKSGKKGAAKRKMMIAIALNKAGESNKGKKGEEKRPYGGI